MDFFASMDFGYFGGGWFSFFHLQANFIPKEILPFVGVILIVVILKIFQAYEK